MPGHLSKECKIKNLRRKETCKFCEKTGHAIEKCYQLRKAKESMKKVRFPREEKNYCTNCKMTNHNTQDCRKKSSDHLVKQLIIDVQQSTLTASN